MTDKSRRRFLGTLVGGVLLGGALESMLEGCKQAAPGSQAANTHAASNASTGSTTQAAAKAGGIEGMVRQAVDGVGGMGQYVKKGQIVAIKPNASFAKPPETGTNTHPEVVAAVVKMAFEAGAKEVHVFDYTLSEPHMAYKMSGIKAAAEAAGATVTVINDQSHYQEEQIPKGVVLKSHKVVKLVRAADVLINVPVCKHHSATHASIGIKNLMGLVWDRGCYHAGKIDDCLADLLSAVRPTLTIIDGTRTLLTNGPGGPGKVKKNNTIIASADPVAADAKAVALLLGDGGITLKDVPYIAKAEARGLGSMNGKVSVVKG